MIIGQIQYILGEVFKMLEPTFSINDFNISVYTQQRTAVQHVERWIPAFGAMTHHSRAKFFPAENMEF